MSDSLPYQKHSPASRAAAAEFRGMAPGARRRVFDYIESNPGCSDRDQQVGLGMNPNTQRPRRIELQSAGHVRPDGVGEDGRTGWVTTDKPYPEDAPTGYWRSHTQRNRAQQPTPEEFASAMAVMREAMRHMPVLFTPESIRVFKWIARQAK